MFHTFTHTHTYYPSLLDAYPSLHTHPPPPAPPFPSPHRTPTRRRLHWCATETQDPSVQLRDRILRLAHKLGGTTIQACTARGTWRARVERQTAPTDRLDWERPGETRPGETVTFWKPTDGRDRNLLKTDRPTEWTGRPRGRPGPSVPWAQKASLTVNEAPAVPPAPTDRHPLDGD